VRCLDHTRGRFVLSITNDPCAVLTHPPLLPPESTTIALLARLSGLMEPLREFVKTKAVWGTCAGAILLSQAVSNPKKGGQELLGGVSVTTMRNGWGSQVTSLLPSPPCSSDSYSHTQVESFEAPLEVSGLRDANIPFMGIFIRAPVRSIFFSEASLCSGALVRSRLLRNSSKRRTNPPSRSFLAFLIRCFHITHPIEVPHKRWSRFVKDDTF
jgi:glutamine amidotransferase PdxT